MNTVTQYYKKNVHGQNKKAGLFLAKVINGSLYFGYSMLNPNDERVIVEENKKAVEQIKAMKKEARQGKGFVPNLPPVKPVFDRATAIQTAEEKLTPVVNINKVPQCIRRQYERFCRNAVMKFHAPSYIKA